MKCYNHPEKDGVAICRACGKALCHECARETESDIACRRECADSLLEREVLFSELGAHLKNQKRASLLGAFFSMGMGVLFIYFSNLGFGFVYDFVFLLGMGFTVYGIVALLVYMIIFIKKRKTLKRK